MQLGVFLLPLKYEAILIEEARQARVERKRVDLACEARGMNICDLSDKLGEAYRNLQRLDRFDREYIAVDMMYWVYRAEMQSRYDLLNRMIL